MPDLSSRVRAAIEERMRIALAACPDGVAGFPAYGETDEGSPPELHWIANAPAVIASQCAADLRTLDRHFWTVYETCRCGHTWPCDDIRDRAAAYGVPVETEGS